MMLKNYYNIKEENINLDEIEEMVKNKVVVLVFRLQNDFMSQLTVEKLINNKSIGKDVSLIEVLLDRNIRLIGNYHLNRLPKFYLYNHGEIVETLSGNIPIRKLTDSIFNQYQTVK